MRAYLAEGLGTFFLVFCGTGALILNDTYGCITHLGIALTFGLTVMVLIEIFGPLSGAHFNPAVSLGFWFQKTLPTKKAFGYICSQVCGALLASLGYRIAFPASVTLGATLPHGPIWIVFVMEMILTFLLMLAILSVAKEGKETGLPAALTVGATVGLEALFAGPLTGASMNPARSLAPALVSGHTTYLWLYLLAPVVGALCATALQKRWIKA